MASIGATERFNQRLYYGDLERLCGYIKNDSIIRREGYSQAQIDAARAELARRKSPGLSSGYLGPAATAYDELAEERLRRQRAKLGNETYLRAVRAAAR